MSRIGHMLSQVHKARSGMATILGMLIFIGVIFTCVIPLFLYVNEANSFYDRVVMKMRSLDQDRERERIDIYGYPLTQTGDYVSIYIRNRCPFIVKIVRVWINDLRFDLSVAVPAMGHTTIESINVGQLKPEQNLYIKVTTTRGNTFSSFTNPLIWTTSSWYGGMGCYIQVVIQTNRVGQLFYKIKVTGPSGFSQTTDVVRSPHETTVFAAISVPYQGEYTIKVYEKSRELTPSPSQVTIDFSVRTSAWVYVYDWK